MDSKETHQQQQQQQNRDAAALARPMAMHRRLSVRNLSLPLRQPQPQQALMLYGLPYSAAFAGPMGISPYQGMHRRLTVGARALPLCQPQPQQALMLYGSPYSAATEQLWMQMGMEQLGRGRPREYAPPPPPPPPPHVIDGADAIANSSSSGSGQPAKRGRGRPRGSRTKQRRNALGGEGEDESMRAHVINVNPGEDIVTKLVAFLSQEPRNVCILSASGAVSSAVLQSKLPLGVFEYEGLYSITHMAGTFLNTESDDGATVTRTANLSVLLAGPDAKIVGGCVGGMLVAASQVQLIVGIFGPEGVKLTAASAPANVLSLSGGGGPGLPQSQGPQCSNESSEENVSPLLHQVGNYTPQPPHRRHLWPGNNPQ